MRISLTIISAFIMLGTSKLTHANLQIDFVESAPKDKFLINNVGKCDLENVRLNIDLSQSQGALIFDTTAAGVGVEVFQPFEADIDNVKLVSSNSVKDGDQSLTILITVLPKHNTVSFSIDVDDTLKNSSLGQIRVTGAEMQGAQVSYTDNLVDEATGYFNNKNQASITYSLCP